MKRLSSKILAALLTSLLAGCGTLVPSLQEFPRSSADGQLLARAIAESVRCNIQNAIKGVIDADRRSAVLNRGVRSAAWFDDWSVQYSLNFKIEESSSVSPSILWTPPAPMVAPYLIGGGVGVSATATRQPEMSFFYRVRDLYNAEKCMVPRDLDYRLQSLLIKDDLKLKDWLVNYILIVGTGAGVAPTSVKTPIGAAALTDKISFKVSTTGNATPSWHLSRLDINPRAPFLRASRDRTHELVITYGPTDPATGQLAGTAADAFRAAQTASTLSLERVR